jgi:hypothetical protein
MEDEQDWRLRADLADARALAGRLSEARHFEHELEPLIGQDVVLSADDATLFAYAKTRAAIDAARRALEHQLQDEGRTAQIVVSHWYDPDNQWRQVEPPPDAAEFARERREEAEDAAEEERDKRIETRTVAISSGRMVRNWFETAVADEARSLGVELSIVEHPHLLTTQLVFTLTGPRGKIDQVIEDMQARAGMATRLETAYLAPI